MHPAVRRRCTRATSTRYKPVYIGEIRADGQFDIISGDGELVEPDSYSSLLHTPEELAEIEPSGGPKK